ncbi:hypothetical protein TSOC_006996 [Tetrabaena socialis]|uniref:ABM domain-containing protein n=1 Tax=Tetrabaena socialis TaxID=47790 RepID=A0A2J8A275_9CHLO|nr:hypothetical protein TSOC_006996 [Tetrabaena socialis]|eukprot:PNH06612.1 hypothetical protein TSOC_006996 [Tetrabaena socialis]
MSALGAQRCSLRSAQTARRPARVALSVSAMAKKIKARRQIACSRTLVAKKGHEEEVAKLAGKIMQWSEEESQVPGKGITVFQVVRDSWEAGTFHFWERYESADQFGDHSTSDTMMGFFTQLHPHLEGPVGVALYTYEDGRLGPACMQEGPKGEGGLDDATGASGAAGGASYKQTSRAFDLTKVDEHEEGERERLILERMGGPPAPGQPAKQPATPVPVLAGRKERSEGGGPKLPLPMPTAKDLMGMAAGLKDGLMSSLGKILRR